MEKLTLKEKNKRFMAERVALLEYMEKTGTSPEELRRAFFDVDCIKEKLPNWPEVMGSSDKPERVAGEVIEDVPPEELPPWVIDKIAELMEDFKATYQIEDLHKCAGVQWRACCQFIGRWFQRSDVLRDKERERTHGGKIYNAERIAALLPVWAELCGAYNHPPLHGDFVAFTGVSWEWFNDSANRLTSSRVGILQKAREIEESGLAAAVADHRQNPVGRMFLLKAKHGYREAAEIVHRTEKKEIGVDALPRLGTKGD